MATLETTTKVCESTYHPSQRRVPAGILVLAAFAVCCLAVSGQSFWIDEAAAVTKAIQPTLAGWWHEMATEWGSDKQMPLYMFVLWPWEKIFGSGEWWLRA